MSGVEAPLAPNPPPTWRRLGYVLPVLVFVLVGIGLGVGLTRDPSTLPSALIGKPVPTFELPPIAGTDGAGFSNEDLEKPGRPKVVNVFASWCVPCRAEHPLITRVAREGFLVYGLNYKDRAADVTSWLAELGDPYTEIGADVNGRVAIDWGVYGVPETFVIDDSGNIVHKKVGPLSARDVEETLLPLLEELGAGS